MRCNYFLGNHTFQVKNGSVHWRNGSGPEWQFVLSFNITNMGGMDADEVAQLYVHRVDARVEWPVKELKAFERVSLKAGQTRKVTLEVPVSELRYWNEAENGWSLEHGKIDILVGSASDDIRLSVSTII